jgi:hypothetical protein
LHRAHRELEALLLEDAGLDVSRFDALLQLDVGRADRGNLAREWQDHPAVHVDDVVTREFLHARHGDVEPIAGRIAHRQVALARRVFFRRGQNEIRGARRRTGAPRIVIGREAAFLAFILLASRRFFGIEEAAVEIARLLSEARATARRYRQREDGGETQGSGRPEAIRFLATTL